MWMRTRSLEHEILDDRTPAQPVVDSIYRFLTFVNRWLGGQRATLRRFEVFARSWEPGARIEVLDVATGAADVPRALIEWSRTKGFDLHVTALDLSSSALSYARRAGPADARLRLVCADVRRPPCGDRAYDYVTCALFFHHLTDDEIVRTLGVFDRIARRGIVVNDLVRTRRAFLWSWLLTRPVHPILGHDGPLSVRRALRPAELERLVALANMGWLSVRRHFGHRMTLAGERPDAGRIVSPIRSPDLH